MLLSLTNSAAYPAWMDDPRDKLSIGQQECLRLVGRHLTSKEIARQLGISKPTVDQRLDRARQVLGASSRAEAARIFADLEAGYDRIIYDPEPVAGGPHPAPSPSSAEKSEQAGASAAGLKVREEQAVFDPLSSGTSTAGPLLRLPLRRGDRNELGAWQRLGWIAAIALGLAVGFGTFLAGLESLGRVALALKSHF